jgi:hypothetical protein
LACGAAWGLFVASLLLRRNNNVQVVHALILTSPDFRGKSCFVRCNKRRSLFYVEDNTMTTETLRIQLGDHADALIHRRAMIIKKALENVRLSHQRLRDRIRQARV